MVLGMDVEAGGDGHLIIGDQSVSTKFHYSAVNECEEEAIKKILTHHELRKKG